MKMVRVAFAVSDDRGLDSPIADRFGRTPLFLIVDVEKGGEPRIIKVLRNPGAEAHGGAAVRAVEALLHEGVKIAVGPNFGPNARVIMSEVGMEGKMVSPGKSVREAIRELGL